MAAVIVFVSTGLLCYWFSRVLLLFKGSQERIHGVLETDLWLTRRIILAIRAMLFPGLAEL